MKYSVLQLVYEKDNYKWFEDSINSMLNQTLKPSDYVIVVNGIVDKKIKKLLKLYQSKYKKIFNVVILKNKLSIGKALSYGLNYTKYNLVARMDSDDISLPDRCMKQCEFFSKNAKYDIVGGNIFEFEDNINNILGYRILPELDVNIKKVPI